MKGKINFWSTSHPCIMLPSANKKSTPTNPLGEPSSFKFAISYTPVAFISANQRPQRLKPCTALAERTTCMSTWFVKHGAIEFPKRRHGSNIVAEKKNEIRDRVSLSRIEWHVLRIAKGDSSRSPSDRRS